MDDTPQAGIQTGSSNTSPIPIDKSQTQLVEVNLPGLGKTYLDRTMAPRVEAFISEAAAHGVNLHFNSAYRTPAHQAALRSDPQAITPADNSLHSAGFAVDVNYSSLPTAQQDVIRTAANVAGLNWGGSFRSSDPPHFYLDPPVDRATAIANAASQYADEISRQDHSAQTHDSAPQGPESVPTTDEPPQEQHPLPLATPPENPPTTSLLLNHPDHPNYALFAQARSHVYALDERFNRVPDWRSDNLAASLTVQARASELRGITMLVLNDEGSKAFVSDAVSTKDVFRRTASVDIMPAMQQSVEESTLKISLIDRTQKQTAQDQQIFQQSLPTHAPHTA